MKRVTIIFDNFGPYHIARLEAAAKSCDLLAIEIASVSSVYEWEPTRRNLLNRKTLFTAPEREKIKLQHLMKRLETAILDHGTEVLVIPGWSGSHAVVSLRLAAKYRIPVVLMSESQEIDFSRGFVKEWFKQRYLALCQSALVGGTPHMAYLKKLGMKAEHIYMGYDVVDNAYFESHADQFRISSEGFRVQHEFPDNYFLASARFIPKKNLHMLIRAYGNYCSTSLKKRDGNGTVWHLTLLGDGELKSELEALVDQLGLTGYVHMPGFIQYSELPRYYDQAGAFVHASTTEQWGLVVNEAMASGLPVLVSEWCGCAVDLVQNGINGYVFDPCEVDSLAKLMLTISSDDCDRTVMSQASREIISRWSPETFADGLTQAVDLALTVPLPQFGWIDNILLWALSTR